MFATVGIVYGSWQILQSGTREECKVRAIREHNESRGGEVGIAQYEQAQKAEGVEQVAIPGYIPAFKLLQE